MSAAGVQAALTRDATTSVHNSACMQRCGLGGQRNTSQLWSGLDGSVGLSNSGRCLQAVPAAAGFTGERLIIGDPTNSTNSCAWRLVVPPYARAPNGSEQLVPHLIIGQPPNSTDHCTSEATCVEEALERCRAKYVWARCDNGEFAMVDVVPFHPFQIMVHGRQCLS